MDLSQLNSLDVKSLAKAPLSVRVLVVLLLLFGIVLSGYFLLWSGMLESLDKVEKEEQTLRENYSSKKRQAIHLETYKQRLADTEKGLAAMLRQLPNKSEMDALLTDINQTGIGRGLEFQLFKPGNEVSAEFYATLPVTIKVQGGYHDLAGFVSDIAKLPRIVTIHNINLTPLGGGSKKAGKSAGGSNLNMDAVIRTYRYLDESELPKEKPASKGKGKGKKK